MRPKPARAQKGRNKPLNNYSLGFLGGALGGAGGVLGALAAIPSGTADGRAPAAESEMPEADGILGSSAPQLLHTAASGKFTVSHFGHLFSAFLAVGGRKHIINNLLILVGAALLRPP
jgi:hypothetical protein